LASAAIRSARLPAVASFFRSTAESRSGAFSSAAPTGPSPKPT